MKIDIRNKLGLIVKKLSKEEYRQYKIDNYYCDTIRQLCLKLSQNGVKCSSIFLIACELNMSFYDTNSQKLTQFRNKVINYFEENYNYIFPPNFNKYKIYFSYWESYCGLINKYFGEPIVNVEYINEYVCPVSFSFAKEEYGEQIETTETDDITENCYLGIGEIHIFANGNIKLMGYRKLENY